MYIVRTGAIALCIALVAAAPADPLAAPAAKIMASAQIPGMQVLVVDNGRVVASGAYGVKDVATKAPVDAHTRFEIGSITKQFTAAAILQLKAQGKLRLSDALGKYVPDYEAGKDVTIAQLLGQVSGIPDYVNLPAFNAMIAPEGGKVTIHERGNFARVLALVRAKPLNFAPGTKWAYSNTNYALLGRIVEIVSGTSWEAYIRAHAFAPAGMTESAFMDDEAALQDVATGYVPDKGTLRVAGTFNGWAGAAGAIVSTASDIAKWDAALFGGKIVTPDDLALMTRAGALPALNAKARYGFGWVVDTFDDQPRLWHNGGTLGFTASNHRYPGLGESIIVLENNGESDSDAVANAVFEALHPALAASAAAKRAAGEDVAVTARAKRVWDELLSGKVDRAEFTTTMSDALTPAVLAQSTAQLRPLGAPTSWVYAGSDVTGTTTTYSYRVGFAGGVTLTIMMSVGADGKISGYLAR